MDIFVSEKELGQRIDHFLAVQNLGLSRAQVQRLIKTRQILINNKPAKASHVLKKDERITVEIPPPQESALKPQALPLEIIYEDKDLLVVNKPTGMVVHPAAGRFANTLVNALLFHCQDLSGIGGELKPGIVHRLDKDTSGLLIVAKNDFTHQALAKQFKDREVEKHYVALVHGQVKQNEGVIHTQYGRHPRQRHKMAVIQPGKGQKIKLREAITRFKVLKKFNAYTLLELGLKTGRTHQLRVHLAYLGYPIVGDVTYGKKKNEFGAVGQLLHSQSLEFMHPRTHKKMVFSVDLPQHFKSIVSDLQAG